VHGNTTHALHALDGPVTSIRHGRGVVHDGSRWFLLQGISSLGRGDADSEVTGRAVVGGMLPRVRAPGGDGVAQGRREVRVHSLCGVGSARRASRTASRDWGSMAAGWSTTRGRGRPWQGFALGLPSSSSMPSPNDKGEGFENPWTPEGDPQQILSPLLVGLQKE
jgi:hypothetical protein